MSTSSVNLTLKNELETRPKHVTFSIVSIYVHKINLGDNPSCTSGPPIQLDSKVLCRSTMTVDEFDSWRNKNRKRIEREMLIPRIARENALISLGVPRSQIYDVIYENMMLQEQSLRGIEKYRKRRKIMKIISPLKLRLNTFRKSM